MASENNPTHVTFQSSDQIRSEIKLDTRERDQRDKNTSTSTFIEHSSEGKEAWTVGVKIYHWSNGESTYGVIFILINSY